jgi:hypothetical protein
MYRTVHRYEGTLPVTAKKVPTCIFCALCPGVRAIAIGAPLRRRSEANSLLVRGAWLGGSTASTILGFSCGFLDGGDNAFVLVSRHI